MRLKLVLATVYGTQRTIQRMINKGLSISYEEYFRYMVEVLLFALKLPNNPKVVDALIKESSKATENLFKAYPQLLYEEAYLYKKQ